MTASLVMAVVAVAIVVFLFRAQTRKWPRRLRIRPKVCRADAARRPYPFVEVVADGSVRELGENDREFLETPFYPMDSGRPYVKSGYAERSASGDVSGFLSRADVPKRVIVLPAKHDADAPKFSRQDEIAAYRNWCAEVIEHEDGSLTLIEPRLAE
ncbi:MAG: hypothetical protein ABL985_14620 [Casimicrobium sp.]